MKTLKILHMYSELLDLYGDNGNMEIIEYRCRMRGITCEIDGYTVGSEIPDFSSYDLIYIGGGADLELNSISADLLRCRAGLKKAYDEGVFLFLVCGGYQLMGKYYRDAVGKEIAGLGLFDYYTSAADNKKKQCIGDIVVRTEITGKPVDVVGFEGHGGQTMGVKKAFGKVLCGNGNVFQGDAEGYSEKNVIATYLHGPCLAKAPEISDYIISYCVNRGEDTLAELAPLDDTFEHECRKVMLDKLLNKK